MEVTRRRGRKCNSYWITSRKREGTENWKKKHWIALSEERALEEAMDLS
jgi:hypothetical protein